MKKLYTVIFIFAVALFLASSCHEWDPVLKKYDEPQSDEVVDIKANTTIAAIKALYVDKPVHIEKDLIIGGQVISSDQGGNVYRSLYIQDATGAIEIKMGKTSLYNDYQPGRWVYVKLDGLTLGAYEGMLQIGLEDPTGEYETTYLDAQRIIELHVFKGKIADPVTPEVIAPADLTKKEKFQTLVTLQGLTYANEVFAILYPADENAGTGKRVYLSDKTWGINTWAMSANQMQKYLDSGIWDAAVTSDKTMTVAEMREQNALSISANYVSHYFTMGGVQVQVRTSGYSKFADYKLDEDVLAKKATYSLTGILTNYRGTPQFVILDDSCIKVEAPVD